MKIALKELHSFKDNILCADLKEEKTDLKEFLVQKKYCL